VIERPLGEEVARGETGMARPYDDGGEALRRPRR